jgi:GYF domain 2
MAGDRPGRAARDEHPGTNIMASRSWFYASDGQQNGPFSEVELREFIARGIVRPTTLVWGDGMSEWTKAGDIPGFLRSAPGAAASFDQTAGRVDPSFTGNDASHTAGTGDRMQELEVSLGRLLRIYWLFMWRSVLGALVIGFALGFILGLVLGALGVPLTQIRTISGLVGLVGGVGWALFCLKMALKKKYRDFRIILVPREIELT